VSRVSAPADAGYTVIEMVVTIALAGALMAMAVSGWQAWSQAQEHDGLVVRLQAEMRQAQQRAVTTGTSTCVLFDDAADTWRTYLGACSSDTKQPVGSAVEAGARLHLTSPSFAQGAEATGPGLTFTPRGTATPGSVRVARDGSDRVVVVSVEGLTGRVSTR